MPQLVSSYAIATQPLCNSNLLLSELDRNKDTIGGLKVTRLTGGSYQLPGEWDSLKGLPTAIEWAMGHAGVQHYPLVGGQVAMATVSTLGLGGDVIVARE